MALLDDVGLAGGRFAADHVTGVAIPANGNSACDRSSPVRAPNARIL
jgi:hypothetical protein